VRNFAAGTWIIYYCYYIGVFISLEHIFIKAFFTFRHLCHRC
jgi:hypothetical protein